MSFVGTLTVFVTYPAEKAVYSDGTAIVAPAGALLPVTSGGTGASTAAGARTALGLGTIATQAANSVAITGGAIDGTTVGSTTLAAGSFTTLNSSSATRLGGLSGNQSLQVNNVASAVNYIQIVGAVTGGLPTYSAQGTDANITLNYDSKGTGYHYFRNGSGAVQFGVGSTASAINYLLLAGSAQFNSVPFQPAGADASIGLAFSSKGSSGVSLFTSQFASQAVNISHTASAVNYLQFTGAATNANPTISAQGSDTDINLRLTPKGAGVVQFGTYTAGILAQAGYITITDAGGTSRRLLVG